VNDVKISGDLARIGIRRSGFDYRGFIFVLTQNVSCGGKPRINRRHCATVWLVAPVRRGIFEAGSQLLQLR
jgi:hypothetical protein